MIERKDGTLVIREVDSTITVVNRGRMIDVSVMERQGGIDCECEITITRATDRDALILALGGRLP